MSNSPFMSAAGSAGDTPGAGTLQQRAKFAKRWASPGITARQKGTEVLVGVVDLCQIDIGDPRDGEPDGRGGHLDQEGFTVGLGQRADLLIAGQEGGRGGGARVAIPAPGVDAHREVVDDAAAGGLLEVEDRDEAAVL